MFTDRAHIAVGPVFIQQNLESKTESVSSKLYSHLCMDYAMRFIDMKNQINIILPSRGQEKY